MATNPWMTSTDLITSVKRKISFPTSQVTFTNNDILAFANEEMFIAQVPSVLLYHEEYFVTYKVVPLQTNLSRYPIPDRATGMKLRDLFWQDQNGNLFDMTRVEEHDRAFFQSNIGANQSIHKFYVEGNDVVLTPGVANAPTGSLVFVFYLRPNQLVKNDRAAVVNCFTQTININNSLVNVLDTISLVTNSINQETTIFTAVNSLGGSITSISAYSADQTLITSVGHQLSTGQIVSISSSNSNPLINGTFRIQVISPDTFIIPFSIETVGTTGSFTCPNQFLIGASDSATAANLATSMNAVNLITLNGVNVIAAESDNSLISVSSNLNVVTLCFSNIRTKVLTSNIYGFLIPMTTIGIQYNSLPSSYTDDETNVMESLFINGAIVDFLQTKPGHRTYVYDVKIPNNGISASSIVFPINSLLVPTGTVNNSAGGPGSPPSSTIQLILANIKIGDYMCLANESIIPQIPPDLHNGLAERASARILAALGDQAGLQVSMQKIAEIEQRQGNLLDNRSEGNPAKVLNRNSLLRYGKMGTNRRL